MIDLDIENTCRICLEQIITKHILFGNVEDQLIQSKIFLCLNEKIENIEGFPCNICSKCYDTINLICEFRKKYQLSRKILEGKLIKVEVKCENNDYNDDEIDLESFSEIINEIPKQEPNVKKPEELLKSLKDMTVKKININTKNLILKDNIEIEPPAVLSENSAKKCKKNPIPRSTGLKCSKPSVEKKKTSGLSRKRKNTKSVTQKAKRNTSIKKSDKPLPLKKSKRASDKTNTKKCTDENEVDKSKETVCETCGKTFAKPYHLVRHKKVHESKNTEFKCDNCPKVFRSKGSLKDHILMVHENVKNAVCDTCGKEFYMKKQLLAHVRYVHLKIRRNHIYENVAHKCRYCDKKFHYKKGVLIHERSVHTGERPAVCSVCQAAFFCDSYLREHMRIHTGIAPFKCPICYRGYAQNGNMKSHLRNHSISELGPEILSRLKTSYMKYLRP